MDLEPYTIFIVVAPPSRADPHARLPVSASLAEYPPALISRGTVAAYFGTAILCEAFKVEIGAQMTLS